MGTSRTNDKELLVLSVKNLQSLVTMKKCIELQEEAFRAVHFNRAVNAKNSWLFLDEHHGHIKLMGCYLKDRASSASDILMVKAVDAFEMNPGKYGLPVVLGAITLFDCDSGLPFCLMDGAYITALRTGAAGGLATKFAARPDSKSVGVIGSGSTAGFTTDAILELLPQIEEVKVFSRSAEHRRRLCTKLSASRHVNAWSVESSHEAVKETDIIVTGTNSPAPVLTPDMLSPGQHINAMGIKTEIDPRVFGGSKIIADSTPIACADGKTSVAIKAQMVTETDVYADLGELVCGKKVGRSTIEEITLFDSSGVAAQDAILADYLYREARKNHIGQSLDIFDGLSELLMP